MSPHRPRRSPTGPAWCAKRLYDVTVAGDPIEIPIEGWDWWQRMLAADIVWAFVSPEMWPLLTQRRGWDSTRYQAWLERSLRDSLLG
jgi:hypothetical protein